MIWFDPYGLVTINDSPVVVAPKYTLTGSPCIVLGGRLGSFS